MQTILVLNPNSNPAVTQRIATASSCFAVPGRIDVRSETLESGPFGIESDAHIAEVGPLAVDRLRARPVDAAVIACYSDPGLEAARAALDAPVFGIAASAVAAAIARGGRFGVIAMSDASIARHKKALAAMGVLERLAAERSADLSVAEGAEEAAFAALEKVGRDLVNADDADVVILGCAGLAGHRRALEQALGRPVIDPVQAAVGDALRALLSR